jgi:hypothetical protein
VSTKQLLRSGWRTDDSLWENITPEAKDSIREFVAAISSYRVSKKHEPSVEAWLKKSLPHFYDNRYNMPVPRFGNTPFWGNLHEFSVVSNRLIRSAYCDSETANIVAVMQESVRSSHDHYTAILHRRGASHVD